VNGDGNNPNPNPDIPFGGALTFRRFDGLQKAMLPWWLRAYVTVPCVIYLFVFNEPDVTFMNILLALAVLLLLWGMTHFGRRRAWKQVVGLQGDIAGGVGEDGVRWDTNISKASFPWTKFIKLRERPGMLLLYYAPRCALYFPRDFFGSEEHWTAFRALAARKLAPAA
jgi:hypothetical protein